MLMDIVCLSSHYWADFWYRKQHFMSRLAGLGYRILYVQPSFSMVRRSHIPEIARNRWVRLVVETISGNVYLLSPPRMLPKPNIPLSSALSRRWFTRLIRHELIKLFIKDPILWIYQPEYVVAIDRIPHSNLVFDLVDDLSNYNTKPYQNRYVAQCIDKLVNTADLMVVTSPLLWEKYRNKTKKCVLVPNGFDERLFDGSQKPIPNDFKEIPRPVVGFVGVLFDFLDYELLYNTAKNLPDISFVFVGPTDKYGIGSSGVKHLETLSNTYFLGRKPREEIPSYISNFDVCINPFKVNETSRAVSPLKVYEYLACGKPVVSTPMEGVAREVGQWVHFTEKNEIVSILKKLLANLPPSGRNLEAIQAAEKFSWACRFNELKPHIINLCKE